MSKLMLTALFSGLLVVGVATAFAEEPQMSDQEVLKAWGVPTEVRHDGGVRLASELKPGLTPLTDDSLEEITGAGLGMMPTLPLGLQLPTLPVSPPAKPELPGNPTLPLGLKFPDLSQLKLEPGAPALP